MARCRPGILYLPRLHRAGYVADAGNPASRREGVPGGLV